MGRWPFVTYAARASCFLGDGWGWRKRRRRRTLFIAGGAARGGRAKEGDEVVVASGRRLGARGRTGEGRFVGGWGGREATWPPASPSARAFLGSLRLDAELGGRTGGGRLAGCSRVGGGVAGWLRLPHVSRTLLGASGPSAAALIRVSERTVEDFRVPWGAFSILSIRRRWNWESVFLCGAGRGVRWARARVWAKSRENRRRRDGS